MKEPIKRLVALFGVIILTLSAIVSPVVQVSAAEEGKTYTTADLVANASVRNYYTIYDNVLTSIKDNGSTLHLGCIVADGTTITNLTFTAPSGINVDLMAAGYEIPLTSILGKSLVGAQLNVTLDNAQVIILPLSSVDATLSQVTDIAERDVAYTDILSTTTVNANSVTVGNNIYFKSMENGYAGLSLNYESVIPEISVNHAELSYKDPEGTTITVSDSGYAHFLNPFIQGMDLSLCSDYRLSYVLSNGKTVSSEAYPSLYVLIGDEDLNGVKFATEDSTAPYITFNHTTATMVAHAGKDYVTHDGDILYNIVDDSSLTGTVNSVKLKTLGTAVNFSVNGSNQLVIPTSQFANGEYVLEIKTSDGVSNTRTLEFSLKVQRTAPPIVGLSHSSATLKDGKTYSTSQLSLNIGWYDDAIISKIELLKDGLAIDDFISGSVVIPSSGTYSVRVSDVLGNSTEYNLQDLFGDLSSIVVVDASAPTLTALMNGLPVNPSEWVTDNGLLSLDVSDDTELGAIDIVINGVPLHHNLQGKTSDIINIDLKNTIARPTDGIYNIAVNYSDLAGNLGAEYITTVKADFDKPTLGTLHAVGDCVYNDEDFVNYLRGMLTIEGSANDIGSGVKSVAIERNDTLLIGQPLEISTDGVYTIRVEDNAGLSNYFNISQLIPGSISNQIVADSVYPVITRTAGFDLIDTVGGKDFYNSAPTLTYNVFDENIKTVSIKINGDEQVSALSGDNLYTISTGAYSGNVSVIVTAIDKSGQSIEDTYSYVIDSGLPYISSASLNLPFKEKGGFAFFKGIPTLVVNGIDDGSGIKNYHLSGPIVRDASDGIFTLSENGQYFITVEDNVGNKTIPYSLKDITGLSTNDVIIDTEAPTVDCNLPTGGSTWNNNDVIFTATANDPHGIDSIQAYINGSLVNVTSNPAVISNTTSLLVDTSIVPRDADGIYNISIVAKDNAENTTTWNYIIKLDITAPEITKFTFTGNGHQEGLDLNGTDSYGFFFKGGAYCDITVDDGAISSGVDKVTAYLTNEDGSEFSQQDISVVGNVARLVLPNNFKGFISAKATDKVGNIGAISKPDGVIVEDTNCFINNTKIELNLPTTTKSDSSGLPLYSTNVLATAEISCNYAGLRSLSWGIGTETLGTVSVNNIGVVTGDTALVKKSGKNLVLALSKELALQGNANGLNLWVSLVDKAGYTSKVEKAFSIDKSKPEIKVVYDKTTTSGLYNTTRVATVSVTDDNFDVSKFVLSDSYGSLGTWSREGNVWSNTLTFSESEDYNFSVESMDRAGNIATGYTSGKFIVDKVSPVLSVNWDNNSVKNGNFFSKGRTATVTVIDKHFNSDLYKVSGNGSLGSWSSDGTKHSAKVSFNSNGEYEFSISGKDMAGNASDSFNSGNFIIDMSYPTVDIQGVQNGVSYKGDVSVSVKLADSYIDTDSAQVTLVGKKNGNLRLTGTIDGTSGLYTFKDFPKEQSYDDIYTLSARLLDKAGNLVERSIVFTVNRFGSMYKTLDGGFMGTYSNKSKGIKIQEVNVDRLSIDKSRVIVLLNGKEVKIPEEYITIIEEQNAEGKYVYTYNVDKKAFKGDGKYLIQIYSKSEVGTEYSSVSQEYAFILDTTKPEVIVSGLEKGKKYRDYSKKVSLDIRDLTGVKDISVTLNDINVPLSNSDGIYSFSIKESSEKQNLKVSVTDKAGNVTVTEIKDFVVTSNALVFLVNQTWFKLSVGLLIAFISSLVGLIVHNRRKSRREEEQMLQQNAELYKESSSASSASLASGGTEKDLVEDLDK